MVILQSAEETMLTFKASLLRLKTLIFEFLRIYTQRNNKLIPLFLSGETMTKPA